MKILFISNGSWSLDLAMKLQDEDNEVLYYDKRSDTYDIGKGIIKRVNGLGSMNSADLIIVDDVGLGGLADKLRKAGKHVVGGSIVTDRMENDRSFGHEIMEASGIKVPKYHPFEDFDEAIKFIKKTDKKYVFKPYGQKDRFLTHVSKNPEEMIAMMEHFRKVWPSKSVAFELQEFVEGLEMAIGGWFGPNGFIKPILPNFEHKKLFRSEVGPNTGEMGTVMAYRMKNKLFHDSLSGVEAFLKTTGYVGYIDLNCIVTDKYAYGLEWTSRFGYPTIQIQDELHRKGSWTGFLSKLAIGMADSVPADTSKWCVGVSYCALPWPLENKSNKYRDRPMFFPENLEHIHFSDVWLDGTQYRQAGDSGFICIVTGSDVDLKVAKEKAYKVIEKINIPGGFYRDDISDKIVDNISKYKEYGWLK